MLGRGLAAFTLLLVLTGSASAAAKQPYQVELESFSFADGTAAGTLESGGALTLAAIGLSSAPYTDPHGYGTKTYESGSWKSAWHDPGFAFSQAIPSWNATTPAHTWIQVELRARTQDERETKWYVLGRWASGDADFHRTSVPGQGDKDGFVAIDTFVPKKAMLAYQLRLTLYRDAGSGASPSVTKLSTVVANDADPYAPSTTTMTDDVILPVPEYSQEIHAGHYPEFDGGGEAWCSPTSTAMILGFWGRGPTPADYAYVPAGHQDPWVDHAARFTYDYNYNGAGNWPFNIAYAHVFGLAGAVTQLRSLAEAEQFVKAGIPLVASISFGSGKLDGFPFKSTNGHLLTIVGFTADGDVVSNDPAALSDAEVQRVYNRAQFEEAWMTSTGGLVYLLYEPGTTLPTL
ncbi:MAG TPA: C39 family peptidase [Gaiellaceae bacterium]|nr:C39 family peptidase [Gaiellaceae bacterium]